VSGDYERGKRKTAEKKRRQRRCFRENKASLTPASEAEFAALARLLTEAEQGDVTEKQTGCVFEINAVASPLKSVERCGCSTSVVKVRPNLQMFGITVGGVTWR
jgi:hypothetical protein